MDKDTMTNITNAVVVALEPKFGMIHDRITDVRSTLGGVQIDIEKIGERTSAMSTLDVLHKTVREHSEGCARVRRWTWGAVIGVPSIVTIVWRITGLFY